MKIKNIFVYIFLFLLTALVLDLANPLFDRPARDGGFFLYAGQQILEGKIPYQDFWDSKGPAIFYINALGLFLGSGSRWGVWFVEFVCIFFTFFFLYRTMINHWEINTALLGITFSGLGLRQILGNGNYTEEYSLLFNALGIFLFLALENKPKKLWVCFFIGLLFGVSFTFRANNIGGLFAILVFITLYYLFTKDIKEGMKILFVTLTGFAIPLLLWGIYFAWRNAFDEMFYASFTFNFSYSAAKEKGRTAFYYGLIKSGIVQYAWIALVGWCVFAVQTAIGFIREKKVSVINLFLLIWFPIEIGISNLSGRNFNHYYISWVPAIALYITFLFSMISTWVLKFIPSISMPEKIRSFTIIGFLFFILLISPSTSVRYFQTVQTLILKEPVVYLHSVSTYILENTQPNDLVLTWYSDTGVNFMAKRTSPVKYVYYPLFLKDSLTQEIETSYIDDITSKKPELILDCAREVDAVPSLDPETRKEQFSTPGLRRKMYIHDGTEVIFDFVKANYHIETKIDNCIIFRLNK